MLLPSPVMIMRAGEPMCGITVVEVLLAVMRENRMRLEDPTDSGVSTEWTWTVTTTECLEIHTCGPPLEYLQDPMLVIANGEFGVARDGQNRRGTIPTVSTLNIDREVPLLTLTDMVGTRTMTIDLPDGRTKIDSGIKVVLGQIGNVDLSSVILLLLLVQQASGRLGRSVKRGNSGNGTQGGGHHTLLPCPVQIVAMTRERLLLPRFHHRGILLLRSKVVIPLGGIWTHRQSTLSHLSRFLLVRTAVSRIMRLGIHRELDPGVQAQCLFPGIPRDHLLRGREKTLLLDLVLQATIIRPLLLGRRIRMALLGVITTTLRHCLRGYLLDRCLLHLDPLLDIMDIPLV